MYCHNCGKQVGDNSRFCRYCGADLREGASKHEQGETDAADGQGAQEKKSDDIFGFNGKATAAITRKTADSRGTAAITRLLRSTRAIPTRTTGVRSDSECWAFSFHW